MTNQAKSCFFLRALLFWLAALIACLWCDIAAASELPQPHMISGELISEDADYWYHKHLMSDGTTADHKVAKPLHYLSSELIGTNEHPVSWQYLYRHYRRDGSVITNSVYQIKTKRERAKIVVPPVDAEPLLPPPPDKLDVFGHIALRRNNAARKPPKPQEIKEVKTMRKPVRVVARQLIDGELHTTMSDGQVLISVPRRINTARVKSAPIKKQLPGASASGSAAGKTTTKQQQH